MTTLAIKELHSWTFSAESVAACTVDDVLNMRKNTVGDSDFFWLGRVPCRSVKIVGMVVGIQVYERKIIYTVDDGTGVVDCPHLHRSPKSPSKATSKYIRIPLEPLTSIAEIGQTVRVTGTLRLQFHNRVISVNEIRESSTICQCSSPNEELLHSKLVRELRRTHYSSKEPFVIPKRAEKSTYNSPIKIIPEPPTTIQITPSSVSSNSVNSSPIKGHEPNTPIREPGGFQSPLKLRHPSRLHTHDLTDNTFRIYLKHYMDRATNTTDYDSNIMIQMSLENMPATPTKRPRVTIPPDTPRQSYHRSSPLTTPKGKSKQDVSIEEPKQSGFTISHLRRVPELSLLASRVVQAVANRREREKRKRSKGAITSSKSTLPSSSSSSTAILPPDKLAGKMKRLFEWAVVQLLHEGCIILWDGPVRPLPSSRSMMSTDTSRFWNNKSRCTPASLADDQFFASGSRCLDDNPMSGYISDPQPDEESYIPLTPSYLSKHVTPAIELLVKVQADKRKPYAGATAEGILGVLKKDDRWRNIGLWNVQDALEVLKAQGAAWDMGKGKWDLTG